ADAGLRRGARDQRVDADGGVAEADGRGALAGAKALVDEGGLDPREQLVGAGGALGRALEGREHVVAVEEADRRARHAVTEDPREALVDAHAVDDGADVAEAAAGPREHGARGDAVDAAVVDPDVVAQVAAQRVADEGQLAEA